MDFPLKLILMVNKVLVESFRDRLHDWVLSPVNIFENFEHIMYEDYWDIFIDFILPDEFRQILNQWSIMGFRDQVQIVFGEEVFEQRHRHGPSAVVVSHLSFFYLAHYWFLKGFLFVAEVHKRFNLNAIFFKFLIGQEDVKIWLKLRLLTSSFLVNSIWVFFRIGTRLDTWLRQVWWCGNFVRSIFTVFFGGQWGLILIMSTALLILGLGTF